MLRDRTSRTIAIFTTLMAVAAGVVAVVLVVTGRDSADTPAKPGERIASVTATDLEQSTIGRITGPGYIAWVGAWEMPGGALMTGYTQAEPSGDPAARERVPASVLSNFGLDESPANRDFWGLKLTARMQESQDAGKTWTQVRADPYKSLIPAAYSQQPTTALPDGTILRRVNGDDLRQDD